MEYITAVEAAGKWGVSLRQVQRLLIAGRIPDAQKYHRSWMIPANAEKPGDLRFEKKQPISSDVAYVNTFAFMYFPHNNPDSVLNNIPERLRILPKMEFAYLRGDFELVKSLFLEIEGSDALKLSAAAVAATASIGTGDYLFYSEIEARLKKCIKENQDENAVNIAKWTLAVSYLGAIVPGMVPDWLKSGDMPDSASPGIPEFAYTRVKYFQCLAQYESMLAAAQIALAFCGSKEKMSLSRFI
jgi:hypothetical protein